MPTGFDQAFRPVKELVADFRANEKFYLSPAYQEQEARHDFIDKFWLALGWDVNHDTQKNPLEQEVKVERKEHSNSQRRADYAFYLHPNYRDVRFYVEAKKPHGDIATADNYFQINRYGWSGKTKIGILHDFEQFEIVDCRLEPNIDKALSRNIRKYKYPDYEDPEKFAEIYWIFSHEAVANGSLEQFAETLKSQWANFQNENGSGKLRLRNNGRCLFKKETLANHGCHSVERQQGHRIEIGINPSRKRHHWLVQASPIAGKARFRFSQTTARHICGRLFLARLPVALPDAPRQPAVLAKQDFTKRGTGSRHNSAIETRWLAGAPPLGAFAEGFGFSRAQNQIRIEHRKPMMQDWHAQL